MTRAPALLAFVAILASSPADAQTADTLRPAPVTILAETVVAPDTVTVGERFRVIMTGWLPPGAWMELDAPADSERVEGIVPPWRMQADSASGRFRLVAEMVAWRAGTPDTLTTRARIVSPDGERRVVSVELKLPVVRSVLPADTTKHRPRGAKDVWGPGIDWRPYALLALAALLVLGVIVYLFVRWRRRRRNRARLPADPRERALALLDEARASGLAEAGDWKGFYTLVSDALRGYAASLDARWSADLTTSELLWRMRAQGVAASSLELLAHVLRVSDLAKFARHRRAPEQAADDWSAARRWVETFHVPAPPPESADETEPVPVGAGAGEEAP